MNNIENNLESNEIMSNSKEMIASINKVVMSLELLKADCSRHTISDFNIISGVVSTINPSWQKIGKIEFEYDDFKNNILRQGKKNLTAKEVNERLRSVAEKTFVIKSLSFGKDDEGNVLVVNGEVENSPLLHAKLSAKKYLSSKKLKQSVIFSVPEKIQNHLLVYKNVEKTKEGKDKKNKNGTVGGVVKYASFNPEVIGLLDSIYAVRLFFRLLAVSKEDKSLELNFKQLKDILGIDNDRRGRRRVQVGRASKTEKKNAEISKYKNFKKRTLMDIIEKINKFTDLEVSFYDEMNENEEISLFFDVCEVSNKYKIAKKAEKKKISEYDSKEDSENKGIEEKVEYEEQFSTLCNESNDDIEDVLDAIDDWNLSDECDCISEMNESSNDVEEVLAIYEKLTAKSFSKNDCVVAKEMLNKGYSIDKIKIKIEELLNKNKKIHCLEYVYNSFKFDEENYSAKSGVGNQPQEKDGYREIGFKNCNISGAELKRRLNELKPNEVVDFRKLFKR